MNTATIRLFVDDSPPSTEARILLDSTGIRYVSLPSSSAGVPAIMVGYQLYLGLAAIQKVVANLRQGQAEMDPPEKFFK